MFAIHDFLKSARDGALAVATALLLATSAHAQSDPLPSWNDTRPKGDQYALCPVTQNAHRFPRKGRCTSTLTFKWIGKTAVCPKVQYPCCMTFDRLTAMSGLREGDDA